MNSQTKSLRSDCGSQTILGVAATVFLLALTLTAASATQLNRQQVQVKVVADALALDLADLLQFNAKQLLKDPTYLPQNPIAAAPAELAALAGGGSGISQSRLAAVAQIGENQMAVTVCAPNRLAATPIIGGLFGMSGNAEICARARAQTVLP